MAKAEPNQAHFWQDIEPEFVTFDNEGDSVEGVLVATETFTYASGDDGVRYTLEGNGSDKYAFNGTRQLNSLMATIENGTLIRVEFVGKVQTSQAQPAKIFKVYRAANVAN